MIETKPTAVDAPSPERQQPTGQGTVIVRAKLVYLRTLIPEDLDYLAEWAEDPFIELMAGSEFLRTYRHVYDKDPSFYEACLTDPTQVVLIVMANHGWTKALGFVRLFNIHLFEGYAFLETIIANHKALRKGFGVEAGKLMCAYGVDVLGLNRIEAKVYEYNHLSLNSLKRHGFHQEGVLRKAGFQGGRYCDIIVLGMLREELEAQRKKENFYFPFEGVEGDVSEPT